MQRCQPARRTALCASTARGAGAPGAERARPRAAGHPRRLHDGGLPHHDPGPAQLQERRDRHRLHPEARRRAGDAPAAHPGAQPWLSSRGHACECWEGPSVQRVWVVGRHVRLASPCGSWELALATRFVWLTIPRQRWLFLARFPTQQLGACTCPSPRHASPELRCVCAGADGPEHRGEGGQARGQARAQAAGHGDRLERCESASCVSTHHVPHAYSPPLSPCEPGCMLQRGFRARACTESVRGRGLVCMNWGFQVRM